MHAPHTQQFQSIPPRGGLLGRPGGDLRRMGGGPRRGGLRRRGEGRRRRGGDRGRLGGLLFRGGELLRGELLRDGGPRARGTTTNCTLLRGEWGE